MAKDAELRKTERNLTRTRVSPVSSKDLLSTGSTLLNCACSGNPKGAFFKGGYFLIVGDSDTGKSYVGMASLAEASVNRHFKDYRLIVDPTENGLQMDIASCYGRELARRLEYPKQVNGVPAYSSSVDDLYYNLDNAFADGRPFIYLLDSMDGIIPEADEDKFQENKKAHEKGRDPTGSYGTAKARLNSQNLPRVTIKLRETQSILIVICQTRDKIGFSFEPKTFSGGKSLFFYSQICLWSKSKGQIKTTVRGKDVQQGILADVHIKKNRLEGRKSHAEFPIYWGTGIDDVGSCVEWLFDYQHWKKTKGSAAVKAPEFGYEGSVEKLIQTIDADDAKIEQLRKLVGVVWDEVRKAAEPARRPRYS